MPLVTQSEVQQWLSDTKTPVPATVPPELINSAANKMRTTLSGRYNTSGWVDEHSFPSFVAQLISMEVAARLWLATYPTPAGEASSYGRWLLERVDRMLEGLLDGTFELPSTETITETPIEKQPTFWPNDAATQLFEEEGNVPGAAPQYFTMGKVF